MARKKVHVVQAVTQAQFADLCKVNRAYISESITKGELRLIPGTKSLDLNDALTIHFRSTHGREMSTTDIADVKAKLQIVKLKKETHLAEKEELNVAKLRGDMIERENIFFLIDLFTEFTSIIERSAGTQIEETVNKAMKAGSCTPEIKSEFVDYVLSVATESKEKFLQKLDEIIKRQQGQEILKIEAGKDNE